MPVRLLPEWFPQSGVLLTWPGPSCGDWCQQDQAALDRLYQQLITYIHRQEKVIVNCSDAQQMDQIQHFCSKLDQPEQVRLLISRNEDIWIRDYGPLSLGNSEQLQLLNPRFNGWGNKYPAQQDNGNTLHLQQQGAFGVPIKHQDFVLEGGSIEMNGRRELLTTRQCLLSPQRNGHLNAEQIEQWLINNLGAAQVHWLDAAPLIGDDTDGHIDTLVRFCDDQTLCYVTTHNPQDPHYGQLQVLEEQLGCLRNREHQPYRLIPLPLPEPIFDEQQQRLPATYANFLIINGAVLVPVYGQSKDAVALETLQRCFPEHEIIGINCRVLVKQNGSLHCATMQMAAGVLA